MSSLNKKVVTPGPVTHGGARASRTTPEQELRRTVMSCLLWEDDFYEDGASVAGRIRGLIPGCRPEFVAACAFEARTRMKLRHAPLLIVREMARLDTHKHLVGALLRDVIQRADELTEFLAVYWKDGRQPLSAQVKKGLAAAFRKFSEHELAKYDRDGAVRLRDVMFLAHPKPADAPGDKYTKSERQAVMTKGARRRALSDGEALYRKVVDRELATPDTWETQLSAGADKKGTFERLMVEQKLGALAFLRNLRGMKDAGVDRALVKMYAETLRVDRVLPFRFLTAARHCPGWEDLIEVAMMRCLEGQPKLPGRAVLVLDVSGSMNQRISGKSELSRLDVAAALAVLAREVCEDVGVYCTAGDDESRMHDTMLVPPRRGFALSDLVCRDARRTVGHGGIFLQQCLTHIRTVEGSNDVERVIVLTDEQDCDVKANPEDAPAFGRHNYIINVATAKNGIAYGRFTHIDGWSEAVLDFVRLNEETVSQGEQG